MKCHFTRYFTCLGVGSVLAMASAASAGIHFQVDFNDMTVGAVPDAQTAQVSGINTMPTSVSEGNPANPAPGTTLNSVRVQESFTSGAAQLNDQPLVLQYAIKSTSIAVDFTAPSKTAPAYSSPESYRVGFDAIVSSQSLVPGNTLEVRLYNSINDVSNMVGRVILNSTAASDTAVYVWSGSNTQTFHADTWELDKTFHLDMQLNLPENKFQVFIDHQKIGEVDIPAAFGDSARGVYRVLMRQGSNNGGFIAAVDNIVAEPSLLTIPEPASLAGLAGLVLVLVGRTRRRA